MAKLTIYDNELIESENNFHIWRYMSLDKFIDFLDTKTLFFSSLGTFINSDPFEGLMPKELQEVLNMAFKKQHQNIAKAFFHLKGKIKKPNQFQAKKIATIQDELGSIGSKFSEFSTKFGRAIAVNCWHENLYESEAMWKIYSDNGKGIAVRSSFKSISRAIENGNSDIEVRAGKVRYIDFFKEIPRNILNEIGGDFTPLLKRLSYRHENEFRLYIVPKVQNIDSLIEEKPIRLKIEPFDLVDEIYISPYAQEPFFSSVMAISKKYGFENKVTQSGLLSDVNKIQNIFGNF